MERIEVVKARYPTFDDPNHMNYEVNINGRLYEVFELRSEALGVAAELRKRRTNAHVKLSKGESVTWWNTREGKWY